MKFRVEITATIDVPIDDLREEIGAEEDDVPSANLAEALQEYINDNLINIGLEVGETEIGGVSVKKA